MSIQTLPTELKLSIIQHLDAESTVRFALTCMQHANICHSILELHTRLFSEWQILDLDENKRKKRADGGKTIWSMLKDVLRDPEKGIYVRELNLPLNRQHQYNVSAFSSIRAPPSPLPKKDQDIFRTAIRALHKLYGNTEDEAVELMTALEGRLEYDDAIVAILIHHIPTLKRIRISGMTAGYIVPLINKIAQAYQDSSKAQQLPLHELTTAAITPWIQEGNRNIDWVSSFLSLPSLQTFAAHSMAVASLGQMSNINLSLRAAPLSNVTTLFFYHCRFELKILDEILVGIKALKKFAYIISSASYPYIRYEPKKLLSTIAHQTKDSLEELIIHLQDFREENVANETLKSISLRCFQELKVVDCRWLMLRPQRGEDYVEKAHALGTNATEKNIMLDFDIAAILPDTLESLFLDGVYDDVDWSALTELFNSTVSPLPNVTKMSFRKYDGYWSNKHDHVLTNAGLCPDFHLKPFMELFDGCGHY